MKAKIKGEQKYLILLSNSFGTGEEKNGKQVSKYLVFYKRLIFLVQLKKKMVVE